jgi:hypothetical protein
VVVARALRRRELLSFFASLRPHGGVRLGASLGARVDGAGAA